MVGETAQGLWENYRFLTKEMMKFLTKQDMNLFYDLLNQRERLQTLIEQTDDDGFKVSPVGQSLLTEIQKDSECIIHNLQVRLHSSKRQHQVSEAYSATSTTAVSEMNWKR
ncbi:hypothetical protein [Desulfosporosinus sp. Sb-LF]|uniref:hypothetical protein n=1 Tax=Desulfosporosinus sp. Sb-LF TaxID=2560027 RepID=UPI00107F5AE2|nr:hypothetical protein [Desulfosporosinus sp. Sb-LF]TGE32605.1 hypothetical protein E4K68_10525 [Desulfosporosinus sp. Sb-LF]